MKLKSQQNWNTNNTWLYISYIIVWSTVLQYLKLHLLRNKVFCPQFRISLKSNENTKQTILFYYITFFYELGKVYRQEAVQVPGEQCVEMLPWSVHLSGTSGASGFEPSDLPDPGLLPYPPSHHFIIKITISSCHQMILFPVKVILFLFLLQ